MQFDKPHTHLTCVRAPIWLLVDEINLPTNSCIFSTRGRGWAQPKTEIYFIWPSKKQQTSANIRINLNLNRRIHTANEMIFDLIKLSKILPIKHIQSVRTRLISFPWKAQPNSIQHRLPREDQSNAKCNSNIYVFYRLTECFINSLAIYHACKWCKIEFSADSIDLLFVRKVVQA